jgi:hypothetical protein
MKKDIIIASILILVAILFRTVLHLGANFELVTSASLLGGYFIKNKKIVFSIPLIIMVATDFYIGNTLIFLFTWSAYLASPVLGILIKNSKRINKIFKLVALEGAGIFSVIIFFIWTNFGVVLTTKSYSKDIYGLGLSYVNAIPFIKPQLISTIIALPILFVIVFLIKRALVKYELVGLEKKKFQNSDLHIV